MTHGPGKYNDAATVARESTGAAGVILLVFEGNLGSGFSVQGPPHLLANLPDVMRQMADAIERDMGEPNP